MLYDTKWDEKLPTTTYKSAVKLKISEAEYAALQQVIRMLESGEIVTRDIYQCVQTSPKVIHMGYTNTRTECGTVACIGGWVGILTGKEDVDEYVWAHNVPTKPLHQLYWRYTGFATSAQVAQAIRNFLTTGYPDWQKVLEMS